jgi:Tfp pilus assembly protein PilF
MAIHPKCPLLLIATRNILQKAFSISQMKRMKEPKTLNIRTGHAILLLAALCALTWGRAVGFRFVWDDDFFIVNNPAVRSMSFIPRYFTDISTMAGRGMGEQFAVFRPWRNISYLFDFMVAGLDPYWWHFHNIFVHFLNSVMVFLIARRLLRSPASALFSAALFLVHPVQTEAVAWVKCRDDLLAAFFMLSSVLLWVNTRGRRLRPTRLIAQSTLYLLACLSKVQAVILPFLLLVLEYWVPADSYPAKDDEPESATINTHRRDALAVATMAPVMFVFLFWRHIFIGRTSQTAYLAGSFIDTMLTMTRAAVWYIGLLLWPHRLLADYSDMTASHSLIAWPVLLSIAVLIAITGAVIAGRRRAPIATFGLLWIAVCLAPVSNVIPMMQFMAERFLYIPMAGFAIFAGALIAKLALRMKRPAIAIAVLLLVAATTRASFRLDTWRNAETLFRVTVRDTSSATVRPRRNLLAFLINGGHYEEALPLARELWQAHATNENMSARHRAEYTRNFGFALMQTGEQAKGIPLIHEAIEIDPSYSTPYIDMGVVTGSSSNPTAALTWFQRAIEADPSDAAGYYNTGIALGEMGKRDEAEAAFRSAIETDPTSPVAHKSLAALLWSAGRLAEAVELYVEAHALWPDDKEIKYWMAKGMKMESASRLR